MRGAFTDPGGDLPLLMGAAAKQGVTIEKLLVTHGHLDHCGQAGIVGSLGGAFSEIRGNEIHEIRQNHQYGGCETAGIKLHGAVDTLIADNHIDRCERGVGICVD